MPFYLETARYESHICIVIQQWRLSKQKYYGTHFFFNRSGTTGTGCYYSDYSFTVCTAKRSHYQNITIHINSYLPCTGSEHIKNTAGTPGKQFSLLSSICKEKPLFLRAFLFYYLSVIFAFCRYEIILLITSLLHICYCKGFSLILTFIYSSFLNCWLTVNKPSC